MAQSFNWVDQDIAQGAVWLDSVNPGLPVPAITSATNPVLAGNVLTLTGTNFGSVAGTVTLTQGSVDVVIASPTWADTSITFTYTKALLEASGLRYGVNTTVTVAHQNGNTGSGTTVINPAATRALVTVASYDSAATGVIGFTGQDPEVGDDVAYDTALYNAAGTAPVGSNWAVTLNDDLTYTVDDGAGGTLADGNYTIKNIHAFDVSAQTWGSEGDWAITVNQATAAPTYNQVTGQDPQALVFTQNSAITPVDFKLHFVADDYIGELAISPSVPTGMTFTDGVLAGTPTNASAATSYTVSATNSIGVTNAPSFNITVNASGNAAPTFDTQPAASSVATTSFTVTASADEAISYRVAVVNTNVVVTAQDIIDGTGNAATAVFLSSLGSSNSGPFDISEAVTGLTHNTSYDVYVAIDDGVNNPVLSTKLVQATQAIVAPVFDAQPSTTAINQTSFTVSASADILSEMRMVVLAEGVTTTAQDIIDGTGNAATAEFLGTLTALNSAPFDFSESATGLTANTNYDVYVALQHSSNPPIISNKLDVLTTNVADVTAPVISIADVSHSTTTVDFTVTSDEAGTLDVVVTPVSETAPTQAEVIAATSTGGGTPAGVISNQAHNTTGSAVAYQITGLTAGTAYRVQAVVTDLSTNSSSIASYTVTTDSLINPPVLSSISFSVANTNQLDGTYSTDSTSGTVYYYATTASTQTAAQIKAATGTGSGNNTLVSTGSQSLTVSNLLYSTGYYLHIVQENPSANTGTTFSNVITTPLLTTGSAPVVLPTPVFTAQPSYVSNTTTNMVCNFTPDEAGEFRAVAVPTGQAGVTASEILSGLISSTAITSVTAMTAVQTQFTLTGLTQDTTYDIYVALRDTDLNGETLSNVLTLTTDVTAPDSLDGSNQETLANASQASTSLTLTFTPNETGTYRAVAVANPVANDPVAQQVIAGTDYDNNAAPNITLQAMTANVQESFTISGLQPETAYTVFLVLQDANYNLGSVTQLSGTTTAVPLATGKFTGILVDGKTSAIYASKVGVKVVVRETLTGAMIHASEITTNTDATGAYSVEVPEVVIGNTYYVSKESADGLITTLVKQVAEAI